MVSTCDLDERRPWDQAPAALLALRRSASSSAPFPIFQGSVHPAQDSTRLRVSTACPLLMQALFVRRSRSASSPGPLVSGRRSALLRATGGARLLHIPSVIAVSPLVFHKPRTNIPLPTKPGGISHCLSSISIPPKALSPPSAQERRLSTSHPIPIMSSQPEHPTLLIPGPIEFDDAVLQSMSHYR